MFWKILTKYVTSINDTLLIVGFSQTTTPEFVFSISASCWDTTDFAWQLPNLRTFSFHSPHLLCLMVSVLKFQTNRIVTVKERPHYPPSLNIIDSYICGFWFSPTCVMVIVQEYFISAPWTFSFLLLSLSHFRFKVHTSGCSKWTHFIYTIIWNIYNTGMFTPHSCHLNYYLQNSC